MSKMDKRCPRQLECLPNKWCELAVLRLRSLRNAGKELTEAEEQQLVGCNYAIDNQNAHYCFFKYLADHKGDRNISDIELASMLNVSIETIKKIEKTALSKMRAHKSLSILKEDGGQVVEDSDELDYKIYR